MIKLPYDEFVTIYDHHNIFRKYGHLCFFACLFKCSLFNIFVYGSLICIYLMNILVNRLTDYLSSLVKRLKTGVIQLHQLTNLVDSRSRTN